MTADTTTAAAAPEPIRCFDRFIIGWRIFGAAYHVERIDRRYSDGRRMAWCWETYTETDEHSRATTYHLGPLMIVRQVGITEEGRRRIARETYRFCTANSIRLG